MMLTCYPASMPGQTSCLMPGGCWAEEISKRSHQAGKHFSQSRRGIPASSVEGTAGRQWLYVFPVSGNEFCKGAGFHGMPHGGNP